MKEHIVFMVRDRAARLTSREVFRYKVKNNPEYKNLSWTQLVEQMSQVSRALLSLNFGFEEKIGIFSDNRPEWTISDLGILGIRGIVVPFYATSSKQEVKYIVDETHMQILFVGNKEQLEKALWVMENSETLKKIVVFDQGLDTPDTRFIGWNDFCRLDGRNLFVEAYNKCLEDAIPQDLASIIYTSGTTGVPKGVMLGHDNFFKAFSIHDRRIEVSENDISLTFLPLSHVYERTWTYYLLYKTAINVYLENPREVIQVLPVVKPTIMCTVPRFFEKTYEGIQLELSRWPSYKKAIFKWAIKTGNQQSQLLSKSAAIPLGIKIKRAIAEVLVLKKIRSIFGGNIRFMPCAGAAISPELLQFFHATGLFINVGYGATETTATVSCFRSDVYDFYCCGALMPDVEVKISNEGEIWVKSGIVFRGYYQKPEETERVLENGWYKTGDKGHFTEKGDLVMTDRIKDLFKTSVGKYISPQKIELLLGQDQYIEQVVVIGDNRKYVTALIVPSFLNLRPFAESLGLESSNFEQLTSNAAIQFFYQDRLDKIQEPLTPYEKVIKFTLLPENFTIDNKALTNTLKVRRQVIAEKYKAEIEKMYA